MKPTGQTTVKSKHSVDTCSSDAVSSWVRFGRLSLILAAGLTVTDVTAQDNVQERLRITEQQKQQQFEAKVSEPAAGEYLKVPERDYTAVDTGGWYTFNYFHFSDSDNDDSTPDALKGLFLHDVRLWANVLWSNDISLYIRAKKLKFDFVTAPGVALPSVEILEDADLDLGFLSIPFRKTRLQLGRQFLQTGRGLVFSGVLDAFQASYNNAGLGLSTYYGTTPHKTHNIDQSIVGFDQGTNDRSFLNVEASYQWPSNHRVYGFFTEQTDHSDSLDPNQSALDFTYDSEYVGIGASGPVNTKTVYYGESIWQNGDSLASTSILPGASVPPPDRQEIDAYAFRGGLNHFVGDKKFTVLSLEYAHASGDEDRQDVLTTFPGNTPGTKDRAFNYFGFYDGGLALSPRLTNLDVVRLGHSFKPFMDGKKVADIQVANIVSAYQKDVDGRVVGTTPVGSVISDPQSFEFGDDVGWGYDFFVSSRVFHDLAIVARYGLFLPGGTFAKTFTDATGTVRHGDDMQSQFALTSTFSF